MSPGPLAGLRVLDAASLYAGPLLAAHLADHGADVVMVEPPGGAGFRSSPLWPFTARGKRSIIVDDRAPEGRAVLAGLASAADVVVVNEPPARLARRGLDSATLLAAAPALVIAHVSGYGTDGPYADRPGNGTVAEALAGFTSATTAPDGTPVLPRVLLGDAVMAWAGAFGVMAACHDVRVNRAPGRVIDVNPLDAMLHVVGPALAEGTAGSPAAGGPGGTAAGTIVRGTFATADGGWFALSVSTERQRGTLAGLVAHPAADEDLDEDLDENLDEDLEAALRAWAIQRDRESALATLVAARLPAAPVLDPREVAGDRHVRARGLVRVLRMSDGGVVAAPAPAPRPAGAPPPRPVELARPGEHTADVVTEWLGTASRPGPAASAG